VNGFATASVVAPPSETEDVDDVISLEVPETPTVE
jgi:hypothetical protein